jgi:DNA-binding protein HU-beta
VLLPDNQFLILLFTILFIIFPEVNKKKFLPMRKADLISEISDKTGIPKVDVMFTLETMFKEIKRSLIAGENIYIRGFGSFITKKRAAKIGRNIKKNVAVEIPEHFIPAFKPAKEFVQEVKSKKLPENEKL